MWKTDSNLLNLINLTELPNVYEELACKRILLPKVEIENKPFIKFHITKHRLRKPFTFLMLIESGLGLTESKGDTPITYF